MDSRIDRYGSRIRSLRNESSESNRQITDLEDKIKELEEKLKKEKDKYNREKDRKDDLEKALKQITAEQKQNNEIVKSKLDLYTKHLNETTEEIGRTKKALSKKDTEIYETKMKLEEVNNSIASTKSTIQKNELLLKQTERSVESTDKKLKKAEVAFEKLYNRLIQVEEELRMTKITLDETNEELSHAQETHAIEMQILEDELYEEVSMKEKIIRANCELEEENKALLCYFMPHSQVPEEDIPRTRTYLLDFSNDRKKDLVNELQQLNLDIESKKKKNRNIQELQESLKESLLSLPEDLKEDLSFELQDLMTFMTQIGMRTKEKLFIFTTLVENQCDPGIVREIGNIVNEIAEGTVHLMETPEALINIALRESATMTDDPKAFRNSLLYHLARVRSAKTKKDIEYCKIVILEGGEYDE